MKPKSIKLFQILGWSAVGVIALLLLITLVLLGRYARYVPSTVWLTFVLQIAILGGLATATYLVVQRRHAVGRILYVALAGVLLLLQLVDLTISTNVTVVGVLILVVLLGLLISSSIFLFQPDANAWLAQGPLPRPAAPAGINYAQGGGYPPQHGAGWTAPSAQPAPPAVGGGSPAGEQAPFAPPPQPEPASYAPPPPEAPYPPAPAPVAPAAAAPSSDGMRTCPFCAEDIKAQAIKCRYCGSAVEPVTR